MFGWGMALVLPFVAASEEVVRDSPAKAGELMRPSWEVRAAAGSAFTPREDGLQFGFGAMKRWNDFGLGFWFDRALFDEDKAATFIGASARAFPLRSGRFDPFVKLDLGVGSTGCAAGPATNLGAGLDVFITDFLKLGASSTIAVNLFAGCSRPSIESGTRPADVRGPWVTTGLELVLAPTERQGSAAGPFRP